MKPDAIIVDMDGTLALHTSGRSPYDMDRVKEDTVNRPIAEIVRRFAPHCCILVVSAREDKAEADTKEWLREYRIPFDSIFMRKTGDYRKDAIIKKELYETRIAKDYGVLFVLDDRDSVVAMWRELGLTCLQVAEGNF